MVFLFGNHGWNLRHSKGSNRGYKMVCDKKSIIDGIGQCCLCNKRWLRCKLTAWGELWICANCLKEKEAKKNE